MAKADQKSEHLGLRDLQSVLLLAARGRVACVLKPYPENVDPQDLVAAIDALRKKKLVHGTPRQPNLTAAGKDAARKLAESD